MPTIAESYPGFELTAFLALSAPARTPPEILDALNGWLNKALTDPTVKARLDQLGMTSRAMTRDDMRRNVQQEIERWVTYTKAAGMEPQ